MKNSLKKIMVLCLSIVILANLSVPAGAAGVLDEEVTPYASNYFVSQQISVYPKGGGKITVEINVVGKGEMTELGALDLYIYEVQDDGRYTRVAYYSRNAVPALIKTNVIRAVIPINYQGVAGKKYYAEGRCYAKNNSGSQTKWAYSGIVTAT